MTKLLLAMDPRDPQGLKAKRDPHGLPIYRCPVCLKETSNGGQVWYADCHQRSFLIGVCMKLFRLFTRKHGF